MQHSSIHIEPGALDNVPLVELAQFLAQHGLELVYTAEGLKIREVRDA